MKNLEKLMVENLTNEQELLYVATQIYAALTANSETNNFNTSMLNYKKIVDQAELLIKEVKNRF